LDHPAPLGRPPLAPHHRRLRRPARERGAGDGDGHAPVRLDAAAVVADMALHGHADTGGRAGDGGEGGGNLRNQDGGRGGGGVSEGLTDPLVPVLGTTPHPSAGRDAVHVAVCPVTAGADMESGTRVFLGDDGTAYDYAMPMNKMWLGIADPFLRRTIKKGERFWLCLYPNSVTSLRHVWTHPAFQPKPVTRSSDEPA